ncbi:MAG TPA: hypothetical protein VE528_05660 [Thermoleophilaceae bacterium]|nr:hypothetical protein [Thermoleophilaceae bacterium]
MLRRPPPTAATRARSDRRGLLAEGHFIPLHLPDGVEHAGFDPLPPDAEHPPERL